MQTKLWSPPLGENSPPTARDEIIVSHMTTPPGEYPGLNTLRLSGAFQVELETDFTNIASQSSPLRDEILSLERRTSMRLELTSKSKEEDPNKGKGKGCMANLAAMMNQPKRDELMDPWTPNRDVPGATAYTEVVLGMHKGLGEEANLPDPTQFGKTSPRVMMKMTLMEENSARRRTAWAAPAA